ncbi:MAG: hypothetical protein VX278_22830 [Myxococcota bacterium]|nr:hypothetical protein [Myxococcota bacterium]
MKFQPALLIGLLSIGCTTGNSFPSQYANAYCSSIFSCVNTDSAEFEFLYQYDNVAECKEEEESNYRSSSLYDSYEEGDLTFNKESAEECLSEMNEVRSDSDCDGDMNILTFFSDALSEECANVYE